MKFSAPLIKATLIKRYKRFLADVILDSNGEKVTVYVPNTGSLRSCLYENAPILLSKHEDPNRKLKYTLEMIHSGSTWIGINTSITNDLVAEALDFKRVDKLKKYNSYKREVSILSSRFDFALFKNESAEAYMEVKNVTYLNENIRGLVQFPDAITARGLKHLDDLIKLKNKGLKSFIFYLVQREDASNFSIASHIDLNYAKGFEKAVKKGVEVLVFSTSLTDKEIIVKKELPWNI